MTKKDTTKKGCKCTTSATSAKAEATKSCSAKAKQTSATSAKAKSVKACSR